MPARFPGEVAALPVGVEDRENSATGKPGAGPAGAGFHAGLHNDVNAEVVAIEQTLGVEPQGAAQTVSARIAAAEAGIATKASSAALTSETGAREAADASNATAITVERTRAEGAEALKLAKASNLSDLASAATARTNLGLGSAATQATSAFDAAGAAASALGSAETFATGAVNVEKTRAEGAEALKAPLASPAFTGNPTAPTQTAGNASTRLATTAYADSAVGVEKSAREAAITILNLGADWSAGDLLGTRATTPPAAHKLDLRDGTAAAPVKIGVTASISRTDATTRAEVNEKIGPAGTDGPDGASALRVTIKGTAASQVQVLAGVFEAWQTGESNGGEASADAGALYGISRVTGSGIGRAIPLYLEANLETATAGGMQGIEIRLKNSSGESHSYVNNGASKSMGLWLNAQSAGTADSAAGIQFGHGFGRQFDVGLGFNVASIKTATIRDDSESLRSILITKPHSKAAIASASGAGPWLVNLEERNFAGEQVFEAGFGEAALDPGVVFGSGLGKSQSIMPIRNSTGNMKIFASNAANAFLTGTAQGDVGLNFTAGKTLHIGAQTKTSLLRVNETGVGVNGATPVAKASAITSPAAELAALKTAVDAIREAIKNFGITA